VFGCFPRSTFERFGLYDERLILNQDWELNQRILRGGGVVWLNPDIRVYYFARQTVRSMLSRAWETGRWVAYMWRLAPHSVTPRHAVPAAFIAIAAVPGLGLAVLAAHQVAAAGAALSEAVRLRDPRLALALPPMFLALHASYGGGTLAGLVEVVTGRKRLDRSSPVERLAPLPSPPSAGRRPPPGRQQAASARPRTRSPKARRT
jgi:hypothetical protein